MVEPVVELAFKELDGGPQRESIELHVGELLEPDVDGVGNAIRALELLARQDGLVRFNSSVTRLLLASRTLDQASLGPMRCSDLLRATPRLPPPESSW